MAKKPPLLPIEAAEKLAAWIQNLGCPTAQPRTLTPDQGGGAMVNLDWSNGGGIHVRPGPTPHRLEYRIVFDGEVAERSYTSMREAAFAVCRRR